MKILLLGSSGLLGSTLGKFLISQKFDVIRHGYSQFSQCQADLTNSYEVERLLGSINPDVIINLVGLTNVDMCESNPNLAYLINVRTVENITNWVQKNNNCYLVHLSTDQVYDGQCIHSEDSVSLTNYYAFSKYAGELAAIKASAAIIRTNFFGRSCCYKRESFTDWIFRSIKIGATISVFDDVFFSPLSMTTVSKCIELIIQKKLVGVFNLGSHNGLSKADFAYLFVAELGLLSEKMQRISVKEANNLRAYRPEDMRMNSVKLESALGIKLPNLAYEIKNVAKEYHEHI